MAACRQLRRLQLDVSLRSAALAIAAVQLIAQSCTDLEVCCVTPPKLSWQRAWRPFNNDDGLLRMHVVSTTVCI